MISRRRLIAYIAINALVSALVTITILVLYHHYFSAQAAGATSSNAVGTVEISSVIRPGSLEGETVVVLNSGPTSSDLTGWALQTPDGKTAYTFPQITLHPNGVVRVHSGAGTDTAIDLFGNLSRPAWRSGDLVSLVDLQGNLVDNYRIP